MAACLHLPAQGIWLLLFVSMHSHYTACNRGQSDRDTTSFQQDFSGIIQCLKNAEIFGFEQVRMGNAFSMDYLLICTLVMVENTA